MLEKIRIYFEDSSKLNTNMGSLFHGFLMDILNEDLVSKLHDENLRSFSQALYKSGSEIIWEVSIFSEDVKEIIIKLLDVNYIYIKNKLLKLKILKRELEQIKQDDLMNKYLFMDNPNRIINIKFLTPTSFKSNQKYIFFPTPRLIIQSALNKIDSFSKYYSYFSEDILKELEENTEISSYSLRSKSFSVESVRIPGYVGSVSLYIHGPKQMVNLMHMAISFSEYTGIGIKTALGMGKIKKIGSETWISKN